MNDLIPFGCFDASERLLAGGVLTTYDPGKEESPRLLYRALTGTDRSVESLVGGEFLVEHICAHVVPRVDEETGEVSRVCRTVMIGPGGERYSTGSASVARCLTLAAEVTGRAPPWNPPIKFRVVRQKPVKGKYPYLVLELT